jgi:hypothetical protein
MTPLPRRANLAPLTQENLLDVALPSWHDPESEIES